MERILITGGMGFLGSHLAQRFLEDGKEVWCLDLYEPPFGAVLREYDRFHMVVDTIKNRPVLAKLIDKVDTVCHLAAVACPDQYVTQTRKVMDITLGSGLDVVEMVRLTGKFLFFTSTSEIYGRNPSLPFREDDDRVLGGTDINRWCYSKARLRSSTIFAPAISTDSWITSQCAYSTATGLDFGDAWSTRSSTLRSVASHWSSTAMVSRHVALRRWTT
jgi:nucleoside-diphosphate-sugar epimerase